MYADPSFSSPVHVDYACIELRSSKVFRSKFAFHYSNKLYKSMTRQEQMEWVEMRRLC